MYPTSVIRVFFLRESGRDELARGDQAHRVKPDLSDNPEKAKDWES